MAENRFFIGIDNTDALDSKGTGLLSRELAKEIESNKLGKVLHITRHQLFLSQKIEYTNRNNAVCIEVCCSNYDALISFCTDWVKNHAHKKSHPVLVFSDSENVPKEVQEFGIKSKNSILNEKNALILAKEKGYIVKFVRKSQNGIIGALAVIGLRATGNDGSVIWINGIEVKELLGTYLAGEVYCETHVDIIKTTDGYKIPTNATVEFLDKRTRPILKDHSVMYLVEEVHENLVNENVVSNNFKAFQN